MRRERALKIVLVVVGLLFTAGVVPLTMFFSREPAVPMIMSIYITLGIFLLRAAQAGRHHQQGAGERPQSALPECGGNANRFATAEAGYGAGTSHSGEFRHGGGRTGE
jgi:hypothetical protein